jgi:hypothetical protein
MTEQSENDAYQSHIYAHLQEKDTEELLAIWEENDRAEWTDEAFDAIRAILLERLGQLPEQGAPRDEYDDLLDEEDELRAEYPTERKLIRIAEMAGKLAWIYLGVTIFYSLYRLIDRFFLQPPSGFGVSIGFYDVLQFCLGEADRLLIAGVFFVLLQAVTEGIYLLMDIRVLVEPEESEDASELDNTVDPVVGS